MTLVIAEQAGRRLSRRLRMPGQALALALGFSILVAISTVSVSLVHRAQEDALQVSHTLQVMNAISQIQILIRRAESAQRGYLITLDPDYLAMFERARLALPDAIAKVRALTTDNPRQIENVDRLSPLVAEKLDEFTRVVAVRRAGPAQSAFEIVKTGRSEEMMASLADILVAMKNEEEGLLGQRTATSQATSTRLMLVNGIGIAAIVALGAVAVLLSRRAFAELRQAQRDLEVANLSLERRVAERTADLKEANEEIQSFAYIVSHDLRSPLVNIMGFTSEIEALRADLFARLARLRQNAGEDPEEDGALRADIEEALGFIKASTTKMDRLIHAILTLSREGRKDFVPAEVDMRALLKSISDSMAHQLQENATTIRIGRLPRIRSDRLALEQIFTNLLDNAVKYLRDGVPGEIDIDAVETPGFVTYVVKDNGRGIDPKDRARVFELFRRSGRQDRPGEGIGLAHVRALVRRMGGTITMESQLGAGTTLSVTLPRRLPSPEGRPVTELGS